MPEIRPKVKLGVFFKLPRQNGTHVPELVLGVGDTVTNFKLFGSTVMVESVGTRYVFVNQFGHRSNPLTKQEVEEHLASLGCSFEDIPPQ